MMILFTFLLGFLTGLAVSILVLVALTFFRAGVERVARIAEKQIGNAGPRPKGAIYLPEDDEEIERQEIIEKNKREGRDTPVEDLRS